MCSNAGYCSGCRKFENNYKSLLRVNLTALTALFQHYLNEEMQMRSVRLPYACCLSTIGLDGFPNARFVSLKEIRDDRFVIAGCMSSRKGAEINASNKVAISFWWPETQRQVRIQGIAHLMPGDIADRYFDERNLDSRIVSAVSNQGAALDDPQALHQAYDQLVQNIGETGYVARPENWGAFAIEPVRIEFLTFSDSRFHDRILFRKEGDQWTEIKLQP
ncbi:pyridoxamine 5'-phosphate oxidase [Taibaiella chishuiensis]|uniref:Pyridoxamine 5'-phosphate oxidase n=1 Tax=Taibaiella chishuiensis TaxID=1434707 RepID=A0A2P8D8H2_9BACT|nr:pyridoxamine 5'-phosphate oxidase [Taibaiella chishuiensis]